MRTRLRSPGSFAPARTTLRIRSRPTPVPGLSRICREKNPGPTRAERNPGLRNNDPVRRVYGARYRHKTRRVQRTCFARVQARPVAGESPEARPRFVRSCRGSIVRAFVGSRDSWTGTLEL